MLESIKTEKEIKQKQAKKEEKVQKKISKMRLRIGTALLVSALFLAIFACATYGFTWLFHFLFDAHGDLLVFYWIIGCGCGGMAVALWGLATYQIHNNAGAIACYVGGALLSAFFLAFVAGFVESKIGLDSEFADALCFYYIPLPIIGINLVAGIIYILFNRVKKETPLRSLIFSMLITGSVGLVVLLSLFLVFMAKNDWAFNGFNILLLITLVMTAFACFLVIFVINKTTPVTNSGIVRAASHQCAATGAVFGVVGGIALAITYLVMTLAVHTGDAAFKTALESAEKNRPRTISGTLSSTGEFHGKVY